MPTTIIKPSKLYVATAPDGSTHHRIRGGIYTHATLVHVKSGAWVMINLHRTAQAAQRSIKHNPHKAVVVPVYCTT